VTLTLRGRAAFISAAFAFAVVMIGTTLPTPLYPLYEKRFDFSIATSSVIFAAYAAGVLLALVVAGRWSDVVGRRPLLLSGLAFAIASDLAFLIANSSNLLLAGRVLSGLSAGVFVGTATAAVIDHAPARWQSAGPVVATAVNIGGLGLGPVLAAVFVDYSSNPLTEVFRVHLALSIIAVLTVIALPETVERIPGERLRLQLPSVPSSVRTVFIGAGVAGFAAFAVTGLLMATATALTSAIRPGSSALVEVSVASLLLFASVLAQALSRSMATQRGLNLGCVLLAVGLIVLVAAVAAQSFWVLVTASIITGVGQGLAFGKGMAALLNRLEPHQRAGVSSALFIVTYIAISLPVIGAGLSAHRWGIESATEAFAAGCAALALLALGILVAEDRRTRPQL
jgi:MFS family permease